MKPLLIVDGYNVIGAWSEAERKQWTLDASRDRLMHLLMDYSGYSDEEVVLVFDGYQSDRQTVTEEQYGSLTLVYTRHGETADSYIERLVAQTPRYRSVRVATSDGLEQSQVLSTGAVRMTSRELLRELRQERQQGLAGHQRDAGVQRASLGARLPQDMRDQLEKLRRADMPAQPVPAPAPQKPATKPAAKQARQPMTAKAKAKPLALDEALQMLLLSNAKAPKAADQPKTRSPKLVTKRPNANTEALPPALKRRKHKR